MARLFPLLLLGLWAATTSLGAQALAPGRTAQAQPSATGQPAPPSARAEILLLFVRPDADEALQQSPLATVPGWTIFRETGPLAGKNGGVIYALTPLTSSDQVAMDPADIVKSAGSYLAQRGANRLEFEPVIHLGAGEPAAPSAAAASTAPTAEPTSDSIAQGDWQFAGDLGLLLLFVKSGKDSQFKSILDTLQSSLQKSPDVRRREQARGWSVMKVTGNGPGGTSVYLSLLDPVVKGANYAFSPIFSEALDGQDLARVYADYADVVSSFNLIDLKQAVR